MKFLKNRIGTTEEGDPLALTPSQEIKGIRSIIVYAVEVLFSNHEYRNEIFDSLLKNGKRHKTRNILVFIYYCTIPLKERSNGEQRIITVEQYLEEQEKQSPLDKTTFETSFVSEEQARNQLLTFLALDSTGVYYFVRDLADYPGTTDMEWIRKIEDRKRATLLLA